MVSGLESAPNLNNNTLKKWRERVDELRNTDRSEGSEDSVWDLAEEENEFRKKLAGKGVLEDDIGEIADMMSDETLGKIEARKEGMFDNLTKVRNRNAFEKDGVQVLSLESRKGRDCSVLMIDLDYFKKINDSYGHVTGDTVLREVARLVAKNIRKSDWIFRYGGEEFSLILPDTSIREALGVAENIRRLIENAVIEVAEKENGRQEIKTTLSIGISGTEQILGWKNKKALEIKNIFQELVKNADAALYSSKNAGRNKVTVFNPTGEDKKIKN